MDFLFEAGKLREELVANRRCLHQNPELGFELPETVALVKRRLSEYGCKNIQDCAGGVVSTIGQGKRTVLLRADMDALPMREESGLLFASGNGCAHSCGHDLHTAMLLGAARLLCSMENDLKGCVKLLFQPAEETASGAAAMLEAGALDFPRVNVAVGMHVALLARSGLVAFGAGCRSFSFDRFRITVTGKGGHGAAPHKAVDSILVASHIYLAMQELVSRECCPEQAAVCTVGSIHAGDSANSIPQSAVMEGTLRAYEPEIRRLMVRRLPEICGGVASAFRAEARVEFLGGIPAVYNHERLTARMGAYAVELLGEGNAVETPERINASEDFANISERVPAVYFTIGAGGKEEGYLYGTHTPQARFDENILPTGAALYAYCAKRWLEDQEEEDARADTV
ncbi:MAG: amidohydrolase [Provencibacterium sp.]|jgi:amidohydrolase|nr:amidohydrolase [Provencibacterium sp.]